MRSHQETHAGIVEEREPHQKTLLETLVCVLELPPGDLAHVLSDATDLLATALEADKVDAFLYDGPRDCLVAVGTSHQALSGLQKRHGLDVLPIANGGRVVQVYKTGQSFLSAHLEDDHHELAGIRDTLGIRSQIGVPLEVGGSRRGVIMTASLEPERWTPEDVRFAESVVRWIGIVAHRTELMENVKRAAVQQGRRAAAEELVTVVAHDLRNLLAPIEGRVMSLRTRAEQEHRAQDVAELERVAQSTRRLAALVTDILDVSRVDSGLFRMMPVSADLRRLTEEVAATLSTPEHAVQVAASEPLHALIDVDRIRQCLENVISNAIAHSPGNASINVTIRREPSAGQDRVLIEITDHGSGVPESVLPHLFDRFTSEGGGGSGLGMGLYLARRIAVLHGGDLSVESLPGQGARFALLLPFPAVAT